MRYTGTKFIGIRGPIITAGDSIEDAFINSLKNAVDNGETSVDDKDVFGITESVVARAQNNYVTIDDIAESVKQKFNSKNKLDKITVIFPILSRNRFSIILKGIAKATEKVILILQAPADEVGNSLYDRWYINEVVSEKEAVELKGSPRHLFTGVNYLDLYREIVESSSESAVCEIYISDKEHYCNKNIISKNIIYAGIHDDISIIKNELLQSGIDISNFITLADICSESINGSGYNTKFGVLGSNKASETTLKLFPNDCNDICNSIKDKIKAIYNKDVEVMVYGDGCFKDPVGGIWEFADPVTTPGFTKGLDGTPNELKLKYLADNDFKDSKDKAKMIKNAIKHKEKNLVGSMSSQGTTPRRYVDLLASAFDLTSGSGDKGTPFVQAKGYFDNYAD